MKQKHKGLINVTEIAFVLFGVSMFILPKGTISTILMWSSLICGLLGMGAMFYLFSKERED